MNAWQIPKMATPGGAVTAEWGQQVVRAVRALRVKGGPNALVSRNGDGTTVEPMRARTRAYEPNPVRPFTVRWMWTNEAGTEGEWQIYLPFGCVSVTGLTNNLGAVPKACVAKNAAASGIEGAPLFGWYRIADPEDADARATALDGFVAKEWTVRVNVAPWARLEATTESDGSAWKSAAVATIAEIQVGTGASAYVNRTATRTIEVDSLSYEWDETKPFSLHFTLSSATAPDATITSVKVVNQVVAVGRLMLTPTGAAASSGTEVKTFSEVWVRVNHAQPEFTLEVVDALAGPAAESDDDKTVWRIYTLDSGMPTSDTRSQTPVMDFYTNAPEPQVSGGSESGGSGGGSSSGS